MRRRSIRSRMVLSLLTLIGAAFVAVFIVFNISVQQYVDANAKSVIEEARAAVGVGPPARGLEEPPDGDLHDWNSRRNRNRNPIGAEVEVFVLDGGYIFGGNPTDGTTERELAEGADLEAARDEVLTVTVESGTYLVSAAGDPADGPCVVFFADITQLQALAENINLLLIVILAAIGAAAVTVAYRLASSVARPIEQISAFAAEIGNNDFTPSTLSFRDREPEELLRVMNGTAARLGAYDREQKTFFQNVSHELKTPLMTIRCNAEGLLYQVMDPERATQTILGETDRLVEMIDELLFVSRLDSSAGDMLQVADLREILSNCAERQTSAAEKRGVTFSYDFDPDPVHCLLSEASMERALSNLISNAVRYASSEVVLACRKEDGSAVIRVWNDGPPIRPEDMPHIFERFFKGKDGQSGIGLSIVRSVAEQLGGGVTAVSDASGTCFVLTLPLAAPGHSGPEDGPGISEDLYGRNKGNSWKS